MSLAATTEALRAAGCVFAEDEARLLHDRAPGPARLAEMLQQRIAGRPLEHVLGFVEFCGLEIPVTAGVFVPRARTALLVRLALESLLSTLASQPVVVDLCCGCGAVGLAIATVRSIELHAVDIDPAAVQCARGSIEAVGGTVYEGDLVTPLDEGLEGRVDVLVANAPYVPTGSVGLMPSEAREHEPPVALDGGADGLDVVRRVISLAPRWLAPVGTVIVETSEAQAPALLQLAKQAGLRARIERDGSLDATALVAAH